MLSRLAVGFVLAAGFLIGCAQEPPPQRVQVRPVRAVRVADPTIVRRGLPGVAAANEEVNLSFRVSGQIIVLPVRIGQEMKKGDLLAQIDPNDYEIKVRTLEAELASVKATADQLRIEWNRLVELLKTNSATQLEVDRAKASLDRTVGQMESVEASLQAAKDNVRYTTLEAPFDGTIAAKYVENFETVQAQQVVLRLLDTSRVKMTVDVPEHLISNARYVESVDVTFQAFPGRTFTGTIHEVGTQASAVTRTYPVTVILDQPGDVKILPGMTGTAVGKGTLPSDALAGGVDVPVSAVFDDDGKQYVWVIDEQTKKVRRQEVQPGEVSEFGLRVSGLEPGVLIATAGVHYLSEGREVRILEESGGGGRS